MIYRVKKQSDICPHCSQSRSNIISERSSSYQSSSSSASQSQKHRIVIPLKNNTLQHNKNIQQTLNILQQEVATLKQQNISKDHLIKNLQAQISNQYFQNIQQFNHTNNVNHMNPPVFDKVLSPDRVDKRMKTTPSYISIQQHHDQLNNHNYPLSPRVKPKSKAPRYLAKCGSPAKALSQVTEIENQIRQMNEAKNQKIQFLMDENENYRKICSDLQKKLLSMEVLAEENQWMVKFCVSFIKMSSSIAKTQGHYITSPEWPLRKNARSCWKFIKHFMTQVIQ